jgi:hypothetical protein
VLCDVSGAEVIRGDAIQENLVIAHIMTKVDENRKEDQRDGNLAGVINKMMIILDGAGAKIRFLEMLGMFALEILCF